jgi:hypothetical protein
VEKTRTPSRSAAVLFLAAQGILEKQVIALFVLMTSYVGMVTSRQ